MTDADIEHANARMLDAFRQCDALRLQLAEAIARAVRAEAKSAEVERDALRGDRLHEYAKRVEVERDEERAHVARLVREVQEMAARRDEAIARAERAEAERDALAAQTIVGLLDERDALAIALTKVRSAEAERDAAKARALPGGRDPGVQLPVVPASCSVCGHCSIASNLSLACDHPSNTYRGRGQTSSGPPPNWCPYRSELAKAGGL